MTDLFWITITIGLLIFLTLKVSEIIVKRRREKAKDTVN